MFGCQMTLCDGLALKVSQLLAFLRLFRVELICLFWLFKSYKMLLSQAASLPFGCMVRVIKINITKQLQQNILNRETNKSVYLQHQHFDFGSWLRLLYYTLFILLYQYYFKQSSFIPSMQSGTELHLALLRKISQLMPTSNFRERFNKSKRRRQYFRGNLTEQSQEQEKNQPSWPLFEINSNKTPSNHSKSKTNTSKKLLREENITISAWSIDEKDPILPIGEQEESRYEKKQSEHSKMDLSEPKKRRNFSFNTNVHIKRPLPEIEMFRSPSHEQNARSKQDKEGFSRLRFSKIRHININLNKENQLSILEHCLVKNTKIGSVDKISSYDAFVYEMKMQERNRKLRN